jgi:hypothetical protein
MNTSKNNPASTKKPNSFRPHSSILLDGDERAAARAMLYPVGFKTEDFQKPLIAYGQNIHPRQKGLHGAKVLIENLPRGSDTRGQ